MTAICHDTLLDNFRDVASGIAVFAASAPPRF